MSKKCSQNTLELYIAAIQTTSGVFRFIFQMLLQKGSLCSGELENAEWGGGERQRCLRWGQAAWPRLHRVWRNSLKTWDVGVCALLSVFEPVTLLVRFVKLSLGCERCSL